MVLFILYINLIGDRFQTGNHDNSRVGTKYGPEMIDPMLMMQLLLPGVSVTYQGEEIGMMDTFLRNDLKVDVTGDDRDAERSPMQWDKSRNAGNALHLYY